MSTPRAFVFLLAVILTACSMPVHASSPPLRVRIIDPVLAELFSSSVRHSVTLQQIVSAIERSDVIVHVIRHDRRAGLTAGSLRFVTCAGGWRFVRVSIADDLPRSSALAMLGHEFQHVLEVAEHSWVRDPDSLRLLYEQIGFRVGWSLLPSAFDTAGARRAEQQVRAELTHADLAGRNH